MTTTTKHVLYFFATNGKSLKTISTKSRGRNADGVMTYESPADCFKRATQLIDCSRYKYDHVEACYDN